MRLWLISAICLSVGLADTYTEDLVITRLPNGNFFSQFKFVVSSDSLDLGKEYELFPRVIAELISQYSVQGLSLSLGMGRWFSEEWGIPPQPSAPTGAYVHAWIEGNETEVDDKWQRVINSLNGIVCTSLTPVIPTLTSSPVHLGQSTRVKLPGSLFRYAALAKETVCTENLTPWRKLLPCKQNGLTTLLNPLKLYDSNYHSMGLNVVQKENQWQLELSLNVVAPQLSTRLNEVDIETLFGRKIVGSCQAADRSSVCIEASESAEVPPGGKLKSGFMHLNVNDENCPRNPRVDLLDTKPTMNHTVISLTSKLGGVGDYTGRMVTMMTNSGKSRRVVFTHSVPWFVQIHYKTLELSCEQYGQNKKVEVHAHSFVPAISRKRPAVIEYDFDLPAESHCQVTFGFKKAFLRLREYPPDSNHGMYVPSAILTVKDTRGLSPPGTEKNVETITVHGNVLLVVLPVPDFSMPFNVICFVLTTITLCFGPIHNFSTKMLIPLNTKLPMTPTYRKILRVFLLLLLGMALYAQYYEIGLNEIRRIIARAVEDVKEAFEKMNSM